MSNSIGNNLLHQGFLTSTMLEHKSRISSPCVGGNSLFQQQVISKSPLSTEFRGNRLKVQKKKIPMGKRRAISTSPQAVLTTDASSELAEKFNLEGNIELQVDVRPPTSGDTFFVDFQVTNSSDKLFLHWGAVKFGKETWSLPNDRPDGTKVYKNRALRTPFVKSGSNSILRLEIRDTAIEAIEFLIYDEAQDKWIKNNSGNFRVKLSRKETRGPDVSAPEELVQIQAYLRWERKGKQNYTPEQEKNISTDCLVHGLEARGLLLLPVEDRRLLVGGQGTWFLISISPMLNRMGLVLGKILYKTSDDSSLP